jgi:hypothetical protein
VHPDAIIKMLSDAAEKSPFGDPATQAKLERSARRRTTGTLPSSDRHRDVSKLTPLPEGVQSKDRVSSGKLSRAVSTSNVSRTNVSKARMTTRRSDIQRSTSTSELSHARR